MMVGLQASSGCVWAEKCARERFSAWAAEVRGRRLQRPGLGAPCSPPPPYSTQEGLCRRLSVLHLHHPHEPHSLGGGFCCRGEAEAPRGEVAGRGAGTRAQAAPLWDPCSLS